MRYEGKLIGFFERLFLTCICVNLPSQHTHSNSWLNIHQASFLKLREILQNEFPGQWNSFQGDNYPAPVWTSYVGKVISAVQMFALMVALVGESIFNYIPGCNGPPEFYYKMKNNPALSGLILFLVIPSYVQSFANTGAFEIYVDEKLVRNHPISIYSSTDVVFFLTLVQLYYSCTCVYDVYYKDLLKISNRKNAEYIGSFRSIRKCRDEEGDIKS
jgi:hypothetical protein